MVDNKKEGIEKCINLKDVRYLLAVASGKGGVGKSTLAVNMARALLRKGYSVGILDADIYGPSIAKMLPAETEIASSSHNPDRLMPFLSGGLKSMSLGYVRAEGTPLAARAPIANSLIAQFVEQVEWGELDYLILDFPPGTGDIHLTLLQNLSLSGVLLVTTPQEVALNDLRRSAHMFLQMGVPIIGLVENMSYFLDPSTSIKHYPLGKGGGERAANEFGVTFLGNVPLEGQISASGDDGASIFEKAPGTEAAMNLDKIAGLVIDQLYALEKFEKESIKDFELIWQKNDYH